MSTPVTLTDPQGNYVTAGGGGGPVTVSNFPATQAVSGSVSVSNLPVTQPVSGTVTVTGVATAANQAAQISANNNIITTLGELNADLGMLPDPAWPGTGGGSVISILKAIHAQNVSAIALLTEIRDNTAGP